jgi:hypothetical protein
MFQKLSSHALRASTALAALCLLTAAKGNGCGGEVIAPEPEPKPPAHCPEGTYEDWICQEMGYDCGSEDDCTMPPPAECERVCVPIDPCGDGQSKQLLCSDEYGSSGTGGCDEFGNCWSYSEPRCEEVCAPTECAYGEHLALECIYYDYGYPEGGGGEAYPGEECYGVCVPDSACPAGYHEETVCTYCDEPECWTTCVPDESVTNSVSVSVGQGGGSGGAGGARPE